MHIETFVLFDTETTGLPYKEKNRTKITEFTLIAVSRRDIEVTNLGFIPPVSKLSFLFNPQKIIDSKAAKITGLSNDFLKNQPAFKDRIKCINTFLEELPKPVCLVAHNGNRFDYKILRAEYLDASAELPINVLCVDSLTGLRRIMKDPDHCAENKNIKKSVTNNLEKDNKDDWPDLNISAEEWDEIDKLVDSFSKMTSSPKCRENGEKNTPLKKTPQKNTIDKKTSDKKTPEKKTPEKSEKISYTLTNIYQRLLRKEVKDAHRAEADCMMLLECIVATKNDFLSWADNNCKLLSDIQPFQRM